MRASNKLFLCFGIFCISLILFAFFISASGLGAANVNITIIYPVNNTEYAVNSLDLNWNVNITTPDWCAYSLDGGANDTGILGGELCYQETANKSNVNDGSCALNYSGNYSCNSIWAGGSESCTNLYDEDWDTLSFADVNIDWIEINYTKPANALNSSLWMIKDYHGYFNFSLTYGCWQQSPLQLKIISNDSGFKGYVYCWDGTDWNLLREGGTNSYVFYEEAMWWNVSTPTNTTLTSLSEGTHNVTIYCNDTLSNMGQSYYTYFDVSLAVPIKKIFTDIPSGNRHAIMVDGTFISLPTGKKYLR